MYVQSKVEVPVGTMGRSKRAGEPFEEGTTTRMNMQGSDAPPLLVHGEGAVADPGGECRPAAKTNITLNWILAAYQNPRVKPGVIADMATGVRTIKELTSRANALALRMGKLDPAIGEDAVGTMFAAVGRTPILDNFDETISSPRRYINAILDRFVIHRIMELYNDPHQPISEDRPDRGSTPDALVEANEMKAACIARLKHVARMSAPPSTADCPKSRVYLHRHRSRKRKWRAVADLFPGVTFRPRRRDLRNRSNGSACG